MVRSSYQYDAIIVNDNNDDVHENEVEEATTHRLHRRHQKMSFQLLVVMMASVVMLAILYRYNEYDGLDASTGTGSLLSFLGGDVHSHDNNNHKHKHAASSSSSLSFLEPQKIPMPHGVNFGSWLSLEDYFYVGATGAVEVATPDENTVGICLPPLHVGQAGAPAWQSETDLLASLLALAGDDSNNNNDNSAVVAHALQVFHAHRTTFITEADLYKLSHEMGIKHVRVPLGWCFTDANPETEIHEDSTDEELLEKFTCEDPFYKDEGVRWPAIPRRLLERFLRSCAKVGITASLDLHTYPGATSPGTFSGIWPKPPRFWKHDDPTKPEQDFGRQLYRDFVKWIEGLDPEALDGVLGISPMNEPAHLAGAFANNPERDYLPPLPEDVAQRYLEELDHSEYIPDGPHLRVFLWLRDAVEVFRGSQLPKLGIQLHVNVHESVLIEDLLVDNDHGDYGGRGNLASHKLIAAWWSKTTDSHERKDWAVLDLHHYHAWSPSCLGASDGPPSGNYACGDVEGRNAALQRCTEWATTIYRSAVDELCGKGAKLMSGEFSTSTHHRVRHACNDIDTLKTSYLMQVHAAKEADVDLYYWSYKMPFGGAFRSAWSFSELMYLLGVTNRPDQDSFHCGGHMPHDGEVTDDFFSG
jgi:hypothetical protein